MPKLHVLPKFNGACATLLLAFATSTPSRSTPHTHMCLLRPPPPVLPLPEASLLQDPSWPARQCLCGPQTVQVLRLPELVICHCCRLVRATVYAAGGKRARLPAVFVLGIQLCTKRRTFAGPARTLSPRESDAVACCERRGPYSRYCMFGLRGDKDPRPTSLTQLARTKSAIHHMHHSGRCQTLLNRFFSQIARAPFWWTSNLHGTSDFP